MANMTRSPYHALVGGIYVNNLGDLKITVNGDAVDSWNICNVYTTAHNTLPYVEVFVRDENDKFKLDEGGEPILEKIEGQIIIEGQSTTCGCWRGRRTPNWWKRIENRVRGY